MKRASRARMKKGTKKVHECMILMSHERDEFYDEKERQEWKKTRPTATPYSRVRSLRP